MKILHTSDWHLGHTLYDFDRSAEHEDMLRQMAEIVEEHKPDVFLLCGDVYHTAQPSSSVQTMFTEAIVNLHRVCPEMKIIITAGNHDSASKLEIFSAGWNFLNTLTIGRVNNENLQELIIEVEGKGFVVAVPYVHHRNMPENLFQTLLDMVKERNTENLPVVMSAHTTVRGCSYRGHENVLDYSVGGIDFLEIEETGKGYDYLALGHIHHEQDVPGSAHRIRYSGSPIPVGFDEAYEHSVSLVEINSHGDVPEVKKVPLRVLKPLVTLPDVSSCAPWEDVKALLAAFDRDIPAYIRLNVEVDGFLTPEAMDEARRLAYGKECRICHIQVQRKVLDKLESKQLTISEFKQEKPVDIAKRYAADSDKVFTDEHEEMFRLVLEMIEEEERI